MTKKVSGCKTGVGSSESAVSRGGGGGALGLRGLGFACAVTGAAGFTAGAAGAAAGAGSAGAVAGAGAGAAGVMAGLGAAGGAMGGALGAAGVGAAGPCAFTAEGAQSGAVSEINVKAAPSRRSSALRAITICFLYHFRRAQGARSLVDFRLFAHSRPGTGAAVEAGSA